MNNYHSSYKQRIDSNTRSHHQLTFPHMPYASWIEPNIWDLNSVGLYFAMSPSQGRHQGKSLGGARRNLGGLGEAHGEGRPLKLKPF